MPRNLKIFAPTDGSRECHQNRLAKRQRMGRMRDLHKALKKFRCDDCSMAFSDYNQFLLHRRQHTSLLPNMVTESILFVDSCPLCFVEHLKIKDLCLEALPSSGKTMKDTEQTMRCKYYPMCNAEFDKLAMYTKHVEEIHNDSKPFACQQCNFSTNKYHTLLRHVLVHEKCKCDIYNCTCCGNIFATAEDLKAHLRIHFPTRDAFKCHLCFKECTSKVTLTAHLRWHYKMFKCNLCLKECRSNGSLIRHIISSHKEVNVKSHKCSHCPMEFSFQSGLARHLKSHSVFKCHLCPEEYTREVDFKRHVFSTHKEENIKSYECPRCGKVFFNPANLRGHLATVNCTRYSKEHLGEDNVNMELYDCDCCGVKFAGPDDRSEHLKIHFPTPDATKCHLCSKECSSKLTLTAHLRWHYKMFKCDLCPMECGSNASLVRHLLSSHKEANVKSHKCSYCPKEFSFQSGLATHLKKHRVFKCHLCQKEYTREVDLKRHVFASHEEENINSYDCPRCGKVFFNPANQRRHLAMVNCSIYSKEHSGEDSVNMKLHCCNCCGIKFATADDRRAHLKIHFPTPDTTKCHLCSKEFATQTRLADHLRRHYKVFKCSLCPKEYGAKQSLKRHLSSHKEVGMKSPDRSSCDKKLPKPKKRKGYSSSKKRSQK